MFVIIGYVVVLGAVFGGYALAGGKFARDYQGRADRAVHHRRRRLGAFLVGNSTKVIKATFKTMPTLFKGSKYTKARYMELMALLYEILSKARKEGLMSIERDVEAPHDSPIFSKYAT
jgi:chemotaxis protein MotA